MKSRPAATKMSNRPSFVSDAGTQGDVLEVRSRMKRWYYTAFKGYRVTRETASPEATLFGGIAYRHTWVLRKDSAGAT